MSDDTQRLIRPVEQNPSGEVVVDNRCRNVWQWKDEQIDSTSIVLKRLENEALELEPTRKVPIPGKAASGNEVADRAGRGKAAPSARGGEPRRRPAAERSRDEADLSLSETIDYDAGGGFDPYNRS